MKEELFILWTTDNAVTAQKMVFMYARNALVKGWWDAVTLVVWGASATLVAENGEIQERLKAVMEAGVSVSACKACADQLGVTQQLEGLGIEVRYWGEPLTEALKEDKKILTV